MLKDEEMVVFGPIPSRRLGRSLGVNNIPMKTCTYSCVYCQLGRTSNLRVKREGFYQPEMMLHALKNKIRETTKRGEKVDYITFVPDGEPTLDVNLGWEIKLFKQLGIKIGVITNASLMWRKDVRDDLYNADWVSMKIDAATVDKWRMINRPHGGLKHEKILKGMKEFSRFFKGVLVTETMLIKDVNTNVEELDRTAGIISMFKPTKSYVSIPIRPPAEKWVTIPSEHEINVAYQIFKKHGLMVECLTGYESNSFTYTGDVERDLLSITAVHPMREENVKEFLKKAKADWETIEKLINKEELTRVVYKDKKFYIKKLSNSKKNFEEVE